MPITSYIIYPADNQEKILEKKLRSIQNAEVHQDDDQSLFILITDTRSSREDEKIQKNLEKMKEIKCTTLSFVGNPDL